MKIKHMLLEFAVIGAMLIIICEISSCKKENRWDMLKRTGEKITEMRNVSVFSEIYLENNINVIIRQGTIQEVKVEGGKNLIPLVKTEVINEVLHVKNNNMCNWARSYKNGIINVYVTIPSLNAIWHFGSGKISSIDTILCNSLNIQTHESGDVELTAKANIIFIQMGGTSDVTLHGKSPLMGVYHVGEGYLHAEDLQTDIAWPTSKASGNEYLNVRKALAAKIEWAGSIYYSGNPADIKSEIIGNGKLIPTN